MRAEIIQHQKFRRPDLLKALFKSGVITVVGKAQRVQQVGHRQEKSRHAHLHGIVGDGRRQVGLAAAVSAHQQQPAVELACEMFRLVVGSLQ